MERIDQQKSRLRLLRRDTLLRHGCGQERRSRRNIILGKNRIHIGIGTDVEGHLNIHRTTIRAGRLDIQHIAHAHNILGYGGCDGIIDRLSVGAIVRSRHLDNRRRDVGILLDREVKDRNRTQQHDNDREHNGKYRS